MSTTVLDVIEIVSLRLASLTRPQCPLHFQAIVTFPLLNTTWTPTGAALGSPPKYQILGERAQGTALPCGGMVGRPDS